jgi:hypothetical protein
LAPFGRKDATIYNAKNENDEVMIKAESNQSISSVQVELNADPNEFQVLEWKWMIQSVFRSGEITKKYGDDYATRIYITFDYPVSELSFGDKIKYRFYQNIYFF